MELYQSMLEEAVASLQGDMSLEERDWSPAINVGAAVLIPEDYVPDLDVRMALYRRLSSLDTKQEREGFAAELIDRFGKLPDEVESLLQVVALKACASGRMSPSSMPVRKARSRPSASMASAIRRLWLS